MKTIFYLSPRGIESTHLQNDLNRFAQHTFNNQIVEMDIFSAVSNKTGNKYMISAATYNEFLFILNSIEKAELNNYRKPIKSHRQIQNSL